MQRDAVSGHWEQMRWEVKQRFQQLSESELDGVDGDRAKLETLLETRYGLSRREAQRVLDEMLARLPASEGADGLRRRRRQPSIAEGASGRDDRREPEWRPGQPEGSGGGGGGGRDGDEANREPEIGNAPRQPEKGTDPRQAAGRPANASR